MSYARIFPLTVLALATTLPVIGACRGDGDKRSLSSLAMRAAAGAMRRAESEQDPCTLLSATEAEAYVGHLSTPPYRATDGTASVTGEDCVYRSERGQLTVKASAHGGGVTGKVMTDVPQVLGAVLAKGGMTGADTMANRVMQQGPAGPWDKITWIPGGTLMVTKGDAIIAIDVTASSGKKDQAVAIARQMMPRLGHPLSYDGAKAVALAPKPFAHPDKACDLVPRAAVEAAIGGLSGAPEGSADGTGCTYTVKTPDGVRTYAVSFNWSDGEKNYGMLKNGMSTMGDVMGGSTDGMMSKLDSIPNDPKTGEMIGALMKLAGGGDLSKASGAPTKVGFKTDTALVGPWDHAALLHGTQLIAVRHGVFVAMGLETADYDNAKALMAAICTRIK
jgi:hypothetical protein